MFSKIKLDVVENALAMYESNIRCTTETNC